MYNIFSFLCFQIIEMFWKWKLWRYEHVSAPSMWFEAVSDSMAIFAPSNSSSTNNVCAVCGWVCLCVGCVAAAVSSNARQCFYSVNRKILLGIFSVIINSCERMRSSWWNRSDCVRLRPNWAKPSDVIHQFGSPTPLCDSWAQKSLAISRSLEEIGIAA